MDVREQKTINVHVLYQSVREWFMNILDQIMRLS